MSAAPTELPLAAPDPAADPAPAPSGLRLLPAPCSEPPYDDERPGGRPLPLRPAGPRRTPLRLVPAPVDPDEGVPRSAPAAPLPDARPFAHALVQRLLETLAGLRPVAQLQRHTSLDVYDALEGQVAAARRTTGPRPDGRAVRSLHVQQRADGVAEVCATVRRGDRYAAVALRLEGADGDWRCTELALP
jgi:hypothetical protein